MQVKCYNCSHLIELLNAENIPRSEECPKCYSNVRSCRMCHFYDINAYNECKEPMAERIIDKEKANYCDYYKIGINNNSDAIKNDALAQANALFKK
ncbi:MAG: hypothetical protein QF441_12080 [Bacteriovoracaceae bacterium]|nr:hypothetical protein [Bacteriovoracaceae bacterium]|tara:strand:- start:667 stop:954 length:288 start_codon:yes stop_codon:yes gene_type:complete